MAVNNDLAKILLVACDQSYWGGPTSNAPSPYGPVSIGTVLGPYLDTDPTAPNADRFPNTMPTAWNSLGLSAWTVQERYDDPTTGFGATLYRKQNVDGSGDYIVAMQGTRGRNIQDWGSDLIYGWDKWITGAPLGGGRNC